MATSPQQLHTVVPLNTMLAELDETVRRLVGGQLALHGFDGVDIAFETPDREWSSKLSAPTVNLFLHDIRETRDRRPIDWDPIPGDGSVREMRPPLRVDCTYAVTAWTREIEDEHRLLSQLMAILYAFPRLEGEILVPGLADPAAQRFPIHTRVAQPRTEGGAEFWSAIGGTFKASVDYTVTLACEAGTVRERGPEVSSQTIRLLDADGPRGKMEEIHRLRGVVVDGDDTPVPDAWIVVPEPPGAWEATDSEGRFVVDRLPAGEYTLTVRAPDGREASERVAVPGGEARFVVRKPRKRKASDPKD